MTKVATAKRMLPARVWGAVSKGNGPDYGRGHILCAGFVRRQVAEYAKKRWSGYEIWPLTLSRKRKAKP